MYSNARMKQCVYFDSDKFCLQSEFCTLYSEIYYFPLLIYIELTNQTKHQNSNVPDYESIHISTTIFLSTLFLLSSLSALLYFTSFIRFFFSSFLSVSSEWFDVSWRYSRRPLYLQQSKSKSMRVHLSMCTTHSDTATTTTIGIRIAIKVRVTVTHTIKRGSNTNTPLNFLWTYWTFRAYRKYIYYRHIKQW